MNELHQLVMQYTDRAIDFAAFHRAFVERFLTVQNADANVWRSIVEVESACADFSEGRIASEDELKKALSTAIAQRKTSYIVELQPTFFVGRRDLAPFSPVTGTLTVLSQGAALAANLP